MISGATRLFDRLLGVLLACLMLLVLSAGLTSCNVRGRIDSRMDRDFSLSRDLTYYVVERSGESHDINVAICSALTATGRSSTTGPFEDTPDGVDVLVTYFDVWRASPLDPTSIISLGVVLRDASTEEEIAAARTDTMIGGFKEDPWHATEAIKSVIDQYEQMRYGPSTRRAR